MGNQSSQLDKIDDMSQRAGRTIGPSMSPTPEPEDGETRPQASMPLAAPLRLEPQPSLDGPPTKGKKRKKQRKSLGTDATVLATSSAAQDEADAQRSAKKNNKKKSIRKEFEPVEEREAEEEQAVIEDTQPEPQIDIVEERHPSPRRKKSRSKKNATRGDQYPQPKGVLAEDLVNGDKSHSAPEAAPEDGTQIEDAPIALEAASFGKPKKRKQRKQAGGPKSSDQQEVPVAHTVGGSPPSAQPPRINHTLKYEPLSEDGEDDTAVIPSSQWDPPRFQTAQFPDPSRLTVTTGSINSDGHTDDLLLSQFAGIASSNFADVVTDPISQALRERDPDNGLGWLHKRDSAPRDTPVADTWPAHRRTLNTGSPALQLGQVNAEPNVDSDGDSDSSMRSRSSPELVSHSPSAQRSERLSRSRSRSISMAPSRSGNLTDKALGLLATARPGPYAQVPYSAPSSTGSNLSIPARLPSPSSTSADRDIPARIEPQHSPSRPGSSQSHRARHFTRDDAPTTGDAMDADSPVVQNASPQKQRGKKATSARKKKTADVVGAANEALPSSGAMDVDETAVNDISSTNAKRAGRAPLNRKTKTTQPTQPDEPDAPNAEVEAANVETMDVEAGAPTSTPNKQKQKSRGDDGVLDSNAQVMANWLGGSVHMPQQSVVEESAPNEVLSDELPLDDMQDAGENQPSESVSRPLRSQKRKVKTSLVRDTEAPLRTNDAATVFGSVVQNDGPAAFQDQRGKIQASRGSDQVDAPEIQMAAAGDHQRAHSDPAAPQTVAADRNDSIEPGELASQPQRKPKEKGRKKRVLGQPKVSLSLSQIEADDDEEDFSALFSRRSSAKQAAPGASNAPEQNEVAPSQIPDSQVPSPEKPRKVKRKRRNANNASEDEMESLLAAGPSKGRKKASKLDLSDNDNGRGAKRKRLATAGSDKASGPWGQDELNALGKVVQDFRDENNMDQHDINKLIQEVPNKADLANKEFWDRADMAIPRRTRKQITERARRIYHNFAARGTWTEAQKEEVHELFESHPKKWAEIAGMINRDQKDVRDYWRNQYLVHETQVKSRWTKEEEERLKEVVEQAVSKIRIERENNDQLRPRPRTKLVDDEAMIDWQQISAMMDLTRSRQQCKWKWVDMREKGLVGDDSIRLPTQPRSSLRASGNMINGISEELANAREDYRGMGPEERFRLIDAIKDSGARDEKRIPWRSLVDERFRLKWHRPTLRLVWYRLRQTVPNYDAQDVEANARHLVNFYHMHQMLPGLDDNQVDEMVEEGVVHYVRGKKIWKRPSGDLRALRERQRRSSSASSRPARRRVSGEILNLSDDEADDDDEEDEEAPGSGLRQSPELGEDRGRRSRRGVLRSDNLEVSIPGHLKGEAAKKALAQARARSKSKAKPRTTNLEVEGGGQPRSKSVAVDSDSDD
ncbi:unnamed protein product [Discula destructiva]